jgi:hypothetical protein
MRDLRPGTAPRGQARPDQHRGYRGSSPAAASAGWRQAAKPRRRAPQRALATGSGPRPRARIRCVSPRRPGRPWRMRADPGRVATDARSEAASAEDDTEPQSRHAKVSIGCGNPVAGARQRGLRAPKHERRVLNDQQQLETHEAPGRRRSPDRGRRNRSRRRIPTRPPPRRAAWCRRRLQLRSRGEADRRGQH